MEARENKFFRSCPKLISVPVSVVTLVSSLDNFFPTERDNLKRNEIKKLSNETQVCFWKSHACVVCNDTKTSAF